MSFRQLEADRHDGKTALRIADWRLLIGCITVSEFLSQLRPQPNL
jgi:hypothetical protein